MNSESSSSLHSNWKIILPLLKSSQYRKNSDIFFATILEVIAASDLPDIFHCLWFDGYLFHEDEGTRTAIHRFLRALVFEYRYELGLLLEVSQSDGNLALFHNFVADDVFAARESNRLTRSSYDAKFLMDERKHVYQRKWLKRQKEKLDKILRQSVQSEDAVWAMKVEQDDHIFAVDVQDEDFIDNGQFSAEETPKRDIAPVASCLTTETWFARLFRFLIVNLINPDWVIRHSCSQAVSSVINGLHKEMDGKVTLDQKLVNLPTYLLEDITCIGLSVLILDEFADFDKACTVSLLYEVDREEQLYLGFLPVKETVSRMITDAVLGLQMKYGKDKDDTSVVKLFKILFQTAAHPSHWTVRLGGLICLYHSLLSFPEFVFNSPEVISKFLHVFFFNISSSDDYAELQVTTLVLLKHFVSYLNLNPDNHMVSPSLIIPFFLKGDYFLHSDILNYSVKAWFLYCLNGFFQESVLCSSNLLMSSLSVDEISSHYNNFLIYFTCSISVSASSSISVLRPHFLTSFRYMKSLNIFFLTYFLRQQDLNPSSVLQLVLVVSKLIVFYIHCYFNMFEASLNEYLSLDDPFGEQGHAAEQPVMNFTKLNSLRTSHVNRIFVNFLDVILSFMEILSVMISSSLENINLLSFWLSILFTDSNSPVTDFIGGLILEMKSFLTHQTILSSSVSCYILFVLSTLFTPSGMTVFCGMVSEQLKQYHRMRDYNASALCAVAPLAKKRRFMVISGSSKVDTSKAFTSTNGRCWDYDDKQLTRVVCFVALSNISRVDLFASLITCCRVLVRDPQCQELLALLLSISNFPQLCLFYDCYCSVFGRNLSEMTELWSQAFLTYVVSVTDLKMICHFLGAKIINWDRLVDFVNFCSGYITVLLVLRTVVFP
jgi:hypothetical protein